MTRKRRLIITALAIALIAVCIELLVESITVERTLRIVESQLSRETGLEFRFGSDFHLEILPVIRFEANEVTVADPRHPGDPLLAVRTLLLEVDPWELLSGVIVIDELELLHAVLIVDTSAPAASPPPSDIDTEVELASGAAADEGAFLQIHRLDVEDLRIVRRTGNAESNESWVIDDLSLRAKDFDEPASLELRGAFDGSRFDVEGEIGALEQLLRPSSPYPVSLRVQIRDTHAELVGSIEEPLEMHGVAIDLRVEARDLTGIGELLALERLLPPIDPVTATARVRGQTDEIAVEELVVRVGREGEIRLELDGSIGDLADFEKVHLVAKFDVTDLQYVQPFVDHALPDVGAMRGELTLSDRDGALGIEQLRVSGGREGTLAIELSGGVDDLLDYDEIELDATIEVNDLAVIGALFDVDLPPIGPGSFSGHLKGDLERITATGRVALDDTVFVGEASGSFPLDARGRLQVRIQSDHVRLEDVGIEPGPNRPEPEPAGDARSISWWSGDAPLPIFDELGVLDAEIALEAKRVTGRSGLEIKHLRLRSQLTDGNLEISAVAAGNRSGSIRMEGRIGGEPADPDLGLTARVNDLDLATLTAQLEEDTESAGLLDAVIDLESRGRSPNEIRSNLAGSIRFLIKDGALASRYGSEFVRNVAKLSLPGLVTRRSPQFGCIVADFHVAQGVATAVNLVLDSDKAHVAGSGTIDVGADAFDLRLQPKAKQPGLLNVAAVVDVSGPLADPTFKPRLRTVPGNVARGLLSNVLSPGTALLRPFRSRAELDALCEQGLPVGPSG